MKAPPHSDPTTVLPSPPVIAVPEFLPIKVLFAAFVPSKLSPAALPTLVLPCASVASIIFFAVNIPVSYTHLTLPTKA